MPGKSSSKKTKKVKGTNEVLNGESKKFEINDKRKRSSKKTPSVSVSEKALNLPEEYGDTKITLLIQNPYWVYAYWEFSQAVKKSLGLDKPEPPKNIIIRVYYADADKYFDVIVPSDARSWYFQLPQPNRPYYAEIGVKENGGRFVPVARSNMIMTPTDKAVQPPLKKMGKEENLFTLSGGYQIHRHTGSGIVSEWVAVPSNISSGISSGSGAFSVVLPPKAKRFFAELQAELILYGSTDPEAELTIGGNKVVPAKDGHFSIRFHIKDGVFSIPFKAESKDKKYAIEINSYFTKGTEKKEYQL